MNWDVYDPDPKIASRRWMEKYNQTNRRRRSLKNFLQFWKSGGPLTSTYIDEENMKTRNLMTSTIAEIRQDLNNKYSNTLHLLKMSRNLYAEMDEDMCEKDKIVDLRLNSLQVELEADKLLEDLKLTVETCGMGKTP